MAAYGLVLTDPLPMVGTYHRAGLSSWVGPLKPLVELVGRRMDVRVAVSDAARATGEQSSGGNFEVLFNGVDVESYESAPPVRDDHDPPRPTVLFVGRHEQRKGLGVLLDAFAMVERPAVLWVASEGPATEVQRRRHPESDRVHWLGVLSEEDKAARLAGADVLCAPSLHGESFGIVLLEGMAAGCAVVASDIEGYRMAAGGHAALVPPGDKEALARALGVALADAVEGAGQSAPRGAQGSARTCPPLVDADLGRALCRRVRARHRVVQSASSPRRSPRLRPTQPPARIGASTCGALAKSRSACSAVTLVDVPQMAHVVRYVVGDRYERHEEEPEERPHAADVLRRRGLTRRTRGEDRREPARRALEENDEHWSPSLSQVQMPTTPATAPYREGPNGVLPPRCDQVVSVRRSEWTGLEGGQPSADFLMAANVAGMPCSAATARAAICACASSGKRCSKRAWPSDGRSQVSMTSVPPDTGLRV